MTDCTRTPDCTAELHHVFCQSPDRRGQVWPATPLTQSFGEPRPYADYLPHPNGYTPMLPSDNRHPAPIQWDGAGHSTPELTGWLHQNAPTAFIAYYVQTAGVEGAFPDSIMLIRQGDLMTVLQAGHWLYKRDDGSLFTADHEPGEWMKSYAAAAEDAEDPPQTPSGLHVWTIRQLHDEAHRWNIPTGGRSRNWLIQAITEARMKAVTAEPRHGITCAVTDWKLYNSGPSDPRPACTCGLEG